MESQPVDYSPEESTKEPEISENIDLETTPLEQEPKKPKVPKKVLLIVGLLLIICAGLLAYMLISKDTSTTSGEKETASSASTVGSVFCTKLGLDTLQCENLDTKELRKYTLPESLGEISTMVASPDAKKYYISAWKEISDGQFEEYQSVYDEKLSLISELPVKKDKDSTSDIVPYFVKWLDNKTLIYTKAESYTDSKTIIYAYDVDTKAERILSELNVDLEHFAPVIGQKYLYGLHSYIVEAENTTYRKLVLVDLETNTIKDIDSAGITVEQLAYSANDPHLYINILKPEEQKHDIKVYEATDLTGSPKLVEVQTIKDYYASGAVASEVLVTKKGLYVTDEIIQKRAPLKFYDESGTITEASLAVGNEGGDILLSLPSFPDFPKAEKNEVVVSDFFRPATGTPEKIVKFLEGKVMNTPNCSKGEYTTFKIQNYDTDQQFSVLQSSCDLGALVVYGADGDSYKELTATQEGIGCEDRDRLGISAKVMPDCRMPGEGL